MQGGRRALAGLCRKVRFGGLGILSALGQLRKCPGKNCAFKEVGQGVPSQEKGGICRRGLSRGSVASGDSPCLDGSRGQMDNSVTQG